MGAVFDYIFEDTIRFYIFFAVTILITGLLLSCIFFRPRRSTQIENHQKACTPVNPFVEG